MFVDATYEGDLMAAAGVQYHVGRESRETYGEQWNGVQVGVLHHGHHFGAVKKKISAYRVPGDPASGVLPHISTEPPGEYGAADRKVQAYCYRMCLTDHPANRVPFPKPAGYDAGQYELLLRIFGAGWRQGFRKFDLLPNHKTDTNNHGPFSTDNIGRNYDYPEASYARRAEILREHEVYQKGLMYFIANDPRMPADVRRLMNRWGLAKDEFVDNGNWPHQIYVREARRMIGKYMMTENELLKKRPTPEPVGMGSYTMDSHNVQRYITPDGLVQNEGDIGVSTRGPYQIAYGSLVPQKAQCENLLVPVCLSSSHIAFGSIRMEPVFMILGQSAATAAVLSLDAGLAVQDLPYEKLRTRLRADGQVLSASPYIFKLPARLAGIVIDDTQAKLEGNWHPSTSSKSFIGKSYRHDGNMDKGKAKAIFEARLKPGRYEVRIAYTPHANRATNAPVIVRHSGGVTAKRINQRRKPSHDESTESIGIFEFENTATVEVRNHGTDGYVTIDAVQFIPASKSK
ncbi:MAG TPA: FAD-dependent oxidoreductase, partial [Verrucomicrobiota bacterium]|nr:FAD-dependent oxidoreductase [Verrucomicrobiota bacterium]